MSEVAFELMTPAEVLEARARAAVAYVPIGPLEWHGPHLPIGTDGLHAHHIASQVARIVGGVVLPPLYAGTDILRPPGDGPAGLGLLGIDGNPRVVGMDLPGNSVKSVYFEEYVFATFVRGAIRALKLEPFEVIAIINGHGAPNQLQCLAQIATEESDSEVSVIFTPAWSPPAPPRTDPGHAERMETSIMLALEGQHVDMGRLPAVDEPLPYAEFGIVDGDAFDGRPNAGYVLPEANDPRLHSHSDEGKEIVAGEVAHIVGLVRQALSPHDGATGRSQ